MSYRPNDADRDTIRTMAAGGIPQERIARCIGGGITEKTLRKHYRLELDISSDRAIAVAVSNLFQQVQAGNLTAIIFWLKTRARWREVERIEHVGGDGGPVKVIVEYEDIPTKAPAPASGTN